jgi:hypothetical protein
MISKIKNTFHIIFIFFIILFLIQSNFLTIFLGSGSELFADFKQPLLWLKCHSLGFDLLKENLIDCGTDKLSEPLHYGYVFLSIPYNKTLDIFYNLYFPYIIIFTFIYLTVKIIDPKNIQEVILLYLVILNPSSMLLIQRLNLDSLIFIIAILIVYNRIYLINWFLIIFLTFIKIFPIALFTNILIENRNRSVKKLFLIFFILSLISFIYLYINKDFYIFMIENVGTNKSGYHFLFSLNSLPKIFKYIFNINYQLLLFIIYSLFIFITIQFYKNINFTKSYFINEIYTFESRIFIVGGYLSLFIFLITSNWFYKEVFIILLIPFILRIKNEYKNQIFNILTYIFIFRYIFLFLYSYISVHDEITYIDGQRIFSNKFLLIIFIKSLFDFLLMSIISSFLLSKTKIYFLNITKKINTININ